MLRRLARRDPSVRPGHRSTATAGAATRAARSCCARSAARCCESCGRQVCWPAPSHPPALLRRRRRHTPSRAGFLVSGAPLPPGSNAGRSAGSSSQAAPAAGLVHAAGFAAPLPLSVRFHLTSVFDYSVYEAVSRVVQVGVGGCGCVGVDAWVWQGERE